MLFVLYSIYYFFFSLFFFSVVYSTTTGGARRDATGPARAAQQHGTGQGGRRAGRGGLREEVGGGRERGEQGTKTAGWLDDREGDLGKQAAAADKEDERAGQDEGWATLLLTCLLLGFEICIKYIRT